jgi:hypothetical protein
MKRFIAASALLASLAACGGSPAEPAQPVDSKDPEPAEAGDPEQPGSELPGNGARAVSEQTDDYVFEYAYPAEAGNIPQLATLLNSRLDELRAELSEQSAEGREAARDNGFPFNKYSTEVTWQVVADVPKYLSLSAAISSYLGGAHGNYGFASLVWNKEASEAIEAEDLFNSTKALDKALGERFCAALNAERTKRRGEPVPDESDNQFDQCVSVEETTVLAGSSNGRTFNRIGIQVGPYVAGPYAEGSYEFTFPVDAAVIEAVKPEYQDSFSTRN